MYLGIAVLVMLGVPMVDIEMDAVVMGMVTTMEDDMAMVTTFIEQ